MKKTFLSIALLLTAVLSFAQTQKLPTFQSPTNQPLYINGSEAMWPVLSEMCTRFNYQYQHGGTNSANLEVKNLGQGSTMGIESLLEGHSNLATSTRGLTQQEKDEFKRNSTVVKEFVVAREALTIVVSARASVYSLTVEQVADIFSGKITNWKDVGGDDMPIKVFIRSNTSGCYQGFKDMFFKDAQTYSEKALMLSSNNAINQHLEKFDGGISFLGYNAAVIKQSNVRLIKLSFDKGVTFVEPTQNTIDNGTYTVVRKCYAICTESDYNNRPQIKAFIEFLISVKNKEIWEDNGFWPLNSK